MNHSEKAGEFARTLFQAKDNGIFIPEQRLIIRNDTKIFAQASAIGALFFVTADTKASKVINVLAKENGLAVHHLDIHNSLSSFSGTLF